MLIFYFYRLNKLLTLSKSWLKSSRFWFDLNSENTGSSSKISSFTSFSHSFITLFAIVWSNFKFTGGMPGVWSHPFQSTLSKIDFFAIIKIVNFYLSKHFNSSKHFTYLIFKVLIKKCFPLFGVDRFALKLFYMRSQILIENI